MNLLILTAAEGLRTTLRAVMAVAHSYSTFPYKNPYIDSKWLVTAHYAFHCKEGKTVWREKA
jgi:hypothetical protein